MNEMNEKVIHEAQSYKMSLEALSVPAPGNTGSMRSLQETRYEISHSSHKTEKQEARLFKNRSKASNMSEEN